MTVTRHGNNAHAELPACPFCSEWAWRTGSVHISTFTQCCYTCGTPGCDGTSMAIFCGIGLAVMFQRAAGEFDTITVPPDADPGAQSVGGACDEQAARGECRGSSGP
jgi:hypothetical protein